MNKPKSYGGELKWQIVNERISQVCNKIFFVNNAVFRANRTYDAFLKFVRRIVEIFYSPTE